MKTVILNTDFFNLFSVTGKLTWLPVTSSSEDLPESCYYRLSKSYFFTFMPGNFFSKNNISAPHDSRINKKGIIKTIKSFYWKFCSGEGRSMVNLSSVHLIK